MDYARSVKRKAILTDNVLIVVFYVQLIPIAYLFRQRLPREYEKPQKTEFTYDLRAAKRVTKRLKHLFCAWHGPFLFYLFLRFPSFYNLGLMIPYNIETITKN